MTNWNGHGNSWGGDAPVYGLSWPEDDYDNFWVDKAALDDVGDDYAGQGGAGLGDAEQGDNVQGDAGTDDTRHVLPSVWITVQVWEPSEGHTGRDCIALYEPGYDVRGTQALAYGSDYYREGMSCDSDAEHEKRIMCFEAAELLYLHASRQGNPVADLNLGYVYSYDRCEGHYLGGTLDEGYAPFDREAHAYVHYRRAAEAGLAEACYKLGDLLRDGRGCDMDLGEAHEWFVRAYELGREEAPVIWGSAALRLGRAFEEGEGCAQSFEEARTWYERATTGLGIAVRAGDRWYGSALRRAEAGLTRTRQELDGRY